MATATRLLALQQQVESILPGPLAQACRVLHWQEGKLLLGVPSPAHSAKLRQVVPRLVQGLQQQGSQVNEIKVRVQAHGGAFLPPALPPPRPGDLGERGLAAFQGLESNLTDGPLRDAIRRLLHRRGSPPA